MTTLCGKHGAEWSAWLSYRLPPAPPVFVQIGTPTPARIREHHEARFREWQGTIRSSQEMITRFCAGGRNCGEEPVTDNGGG